MSIERIGPFCQKTIINNKKKCNLKKLPIGNIENKSFIQTYKSLLGFYADINKMEYNLLQKVTLKFYLVDLKQCESLDIYITIIKKCSDAQWIKKEIVKTIYSCDIGSYITVDLSGFITDIDLNICKKIFLGLETNNRNGIAIIESRYSYNKPFIEFKYLVENEEHKALRYSQEQGGLMGSIGSKGTMALMEKQRIQEEFIPQESRGLRGIQGEPGPQGIQGEMGPQGPEAGTCNAEVMRDILCELVGQEIEVVVEDNVIKKFKGIVSSVNGYNLILKDGKYYQIISIYYIMGLCGEGDIENVDIKDKCDSRNFSVFQQGISDIMCYLKEKKVSILLDGIYMNIGSAEILDVCEGLIKLRECNSKNPKTCILNNYYIKVIENVILE